MKKILMACANDWYSPFQVGSHHLAREFVRRGYEVAFISDPISPAHLLSPGGRLGARAKIYAKGGVRDLGGKLWAYVPGALLTPHNKPLLRSAWVQSYWPHLSYPNVVLKAAREGFGQVDLLYFDSVAQAFWLKYLRAKRSLLRLADNNAGFDRSTVSSREAEAVLAGSVDAVAYTAESLREKVRSLRPRKSFHLPNGVHFAHFQEASRERPPEYQGVRGPILVYVGALEGWFDWDLLGQAAASLPKATFFIIGRGGPSGGGRLPANVRLLGTRPYGAVPAYLWNADAGIIPFRVKEYPELVNSIHPLKLYEYMACGLPVVSVAWRELRNLGSPALLSGTREGFIGDLRKVLGRKRDPKRFVQYAKKQDWSGRLDLLLKSLGGLP